MCGECARRHYGGGVCSDGVRGTGMGYDGGYWAYIVKHCTGLKRIEHCFNSVLSLFALYYNSINNDQINVKNWPNACRFGAILFKYL